MKKNTPQSVPYRIPTYRLGRGNLYRAIVSLPERLTAPDRPLQERVVFFEAETGPGFQLEELLSLAWRCSTRDWCADGHIYNVRSAVELINEWSIGGEASGDLRLFETGCGGVNGIGPERAHYARAADIDLFVTPQVATRLREAIARIEALYTQQVQA